MYVHAMALGYKVRRTRLYIRHTLYVMTNIVDVRFCTWFAPLIPALLPEAPTETLESLLLATQQQ